MSFTATPPSTTTTTTPDETTTTTVPITPETSVVTTPPTTVPVTPNAGGGLPVTGAQSLILAVVALLLVGLGVGFRIVSKRAEGTT